jgi:hypothetical protein
VSILTSATVLDLWEAGLSMTPASRAVLLLEATGETDLGTWPVGRRDEELLKRYCTGTSTQEAVAGCPECGTTLEIVFDPLKLTGGGVDGPVRLEVDEYRVTARPPTVEDLAALPASADPEAWRRLLLSRCVLEAERLGEGVDVGDLPDDVVTRIEDALDEADPAADIRFPLTCHDCGTSWSESLDPVEFAWSTIETAARHLATDVHTLAHAYGWGEHEILGLSPFRRHLYLSAVGP